MEQDSGPIFPDGKWFSGMPTYKLYAWRARLKWSEEEMQSFYEVCCRMAETSPLSVEQVIDMVARQLLNNWLSKEEILSNMEHILVITSRELKEIGHAMQYAQNWAHGTSGHGQLMLIAKTYEFLGFYFDEKNNLVVPDKVRVDDGPTTGHGKAG